ncbi:hypothetical protein PG993_002925 [Apiospora rasikravindrae]|uniref:Zn(2)-C6 fungal-type domain-containing protein n=1 Tax=Apiospora rasikravindrae TaxID=990691 RepID=A0ABR1TXY7_9PEZI
MHKRRSHHKSRNGCYSCKQKHVKCDEQGPPCTNCVLREAECIYPTPEELEEARLRKQTAGDAVRPKTKAPKLVKKESPPSCLAPTTPQLLSGPSQPPVSGEPIYDRFLELELMHQWTTKTWMGFYGVPEDQRYLQEELPRTALGEGYLLNGILAIAATDLAQQAAGLVSPKYICAALGYSNRASIQFRQQLSKMAATNNHHVLYHGGIMVERRNFSAINNEAARDAAGEYHSQQDHHHPHRLLERLDVFFKLLLGTYNTLLTNIQWTMDSPTTIRAAVDKLLKEPLAIDLVNFETRLAMERLTRVSQQFRTNFPIHNNGDAAAAPQPALGCLCSEVPAYRLIISQTKLSFVVEALNLSQGLCLSLITTTGLDFLNLVKAMDPMALFVLIHLGVLFYRLFEKWNGFGWAMGNIVQELVKELSRILEATPIYHLQEGRDGIVWCQQQTGLLPLPGMEAETIVLPANRTLLPLYPQFHNAKEVDSPQVEYKATVPWSQTWEKSKVY